MLGERSAQRGLFEADHPYLDYVGRGSFYGFLASQRGKLFRDQDFAAEVAGPVEKISPFGGWKLAVAVPD